MELIRYTHKPLGPVQRETHGAPQYVDEGLRVIKALAGVTATAVDGLRRRVLLMAQTKGNATSRNRRSCSRRSTTRTGRLTEKPRRVFPSGPLSFTCQGEPADRDCITSW